MFLIHWNAISQYCQNSVVQEYVDYYFFFKKKADTQFQFFIPVQAKIKSCYPPRSCLACAKALWEDSEHHPSGKASNHSASIPERGL